MAAADRGIPHHAVTHHFMACELMGRPSARTHRSILSLCDNGWEDLTTICDISDDGKIERRLMRDPKGEFHIVSETLDLDAGKWTVTTEEVSPARARDFYVHTCIPESLAKGFHEWVSPSARLATGVEEMSALAELIALYGNDNSIAVQTSRERLKVGIHHLVRHTSERVREAQEAAI